MESAGPQIIEAATDRLVLLFGDTFPDSPIARIRLGYQDFVKPFLKNEPHPSRKSKSGGWRIVICLTLVDQLVERVLYTNFINAVKYAYPGPGVVIGIGFTDEQSLQFNKSLDRTKPMMSTDVEGWDRSVDETWTHEFAERRRRALPSTGFIRYGVAITRNNEIMVDPVYIVDVGGDETHLYMRGSPGGIISGRLLTNFMGGDIRLEVAFQAGAEYAKACGDDCIEVHANQASVVERYRKLGFKLRKPVKLKDTELEFCSHEYSKDSNYKPRLTSWPKAFHKLLTRKVDSVQVRAFLYECRNNENFEALRGYVEEHFANMDTDEMCP